jgi:hypothetical protein
MRRQDHALEAPSFFQALSNQAMFDEVLSGQATSSELVSHSRQFLPNLSCGKSSPRLGHNHEGARNELMPGLAEHSRQGKLAETRGRP